MVTLFSRAWQRDTLARAGRQAVQAALPLAVLIASGSIKGADPLAFGLGVALAVVVTVIGATLGASFGPDAAAWQQALERALKAGLGALAAVLPTNALDLLHLDFRAVGLMVLGSVLLSLAAMVTNTPTAVDLSNPNGRSVPRGQEEGD